MSNKADDIHSCSPFCKRPECVKERGNKEPEVVAWMYRGEDWFDGDKWHKKYEVTTSEQVASFKEYMGNPKQPLITLQSHREAIASVEKLKEHYQDLWSDVCNENQVLLNAIAQAKEAQQ